MNMLKRTISKTTILRSSLLALVVSLLLSSVPVNALTGAEFRAGRIMDDDIFFQGNAMLAADVQAFLNAKVPSCDTNGDQAYAGTTRRAYSQARGYNPPYTCLKDYRQDVPAKSAETGLCNGIAAGNKSSADIIYEVGASCGISQRVLLILLQKEQSLVTDDWPWSIQYRSATGYGCPDTAACDSTYYGFFNQVYMAARQYKRYVRDANLFSYKAGQTSYILYNPNSACGGSNVYIENNATAALYNYTPYQPNASALANLYGTGDGCGAYGNRNFWRMYNDWFGDVYGNVIGQTAYRFYNPSTGTHYYTAREGERSYIRRLGFKDDGTAFPVGFHNVDDVGVPMQAIYRLHNTGIEDYWYVPDGPAYYWGVVKGGYRDESFSYFAYPTNANGSPTPCTKGTPVLAMWRPGTTEHFYTTSGGDRYWALIYGGYVDDMSASWFNPNVGAVPYCMPSA